MKVTVNLEKCIGCDMCFDISGGVIGTKFGTEGKAGVSLDIDLEDRVIKTNVKLAAEVCPMQAIEVLENQ